MVFSLCRAGTRIIFNKSILLNCNRKAFLTVTRHNSIKLNSRMEKIIAIGQMCSSNNKAQNRQQVQEIVKSAVEQKACFVFLPECCDYVGTNRNETISLAEPLNGETVSFYKQLAKENNVWLSLGGIHEVIFDEKNEKTDKLHNSHIIINNLGELTAIYRKLHLFDVETSEFTFRESKVMNPGNSIVSPLNNTPLQEGLCLLICYDLRFPELSTILRKNGGKILTYPSAFSYPTGIAHWECLLRARAIENQCFVIAAAQTGYHNEKRRSYGHAMVVDPWGKILIECDDQTVPQCRSVKINLQEMQNTRNRLPCFEHRRNDVYALNAIEIISAEKSLIDKSVHFKPVAVENEEIPYFLFEKHPVPESTIFYETPLSIAFTNISCVVPGHILVANRRCVARLKDLTADEITDFFMTVCKCQRLLEQYYKTTSSTVTVQDGEFAGQTVKHVHCHIMPRKEGDFEHNDEIYIELNRHDHPDENRRFRSVEERTTEANQYRQMFETFKMF